MNTPETQIVHMESGEKPLPLILVKSAEKMGAQITTNESGLTLIKLKSLVGALILENLIVDLGMRSTVHQDITQE